MKAKYSAPLPVFAVLVFVYAVTLAPGVTLWDSGEFLAAVKTLGIPHPAGTPLFTLVAKCWSLVFAPLFGFAKAVNLLSAAATAGGCAVLSRLFAKWSGSNMVGVCAGVLAGSMSTIWLSATETEVYALVLLLGLVILWAADRAGSSGESRWTLLAAYLAGLACALHLEALVVLPAAAVLAFSGRDGSFRLPRERGWPDAPSADRSPLRLGLYPLALVVLGASCVLFMLVRARHDPAINQGNPSTLSALWDVLTRRQYGARSVWPRSVPLYLQLGNVIQYSDWQLALGLSGEPGPSVLRTGVTLCYAALAAFGSYQHRLIDRRSWRAWSVLLLSATIGVVLYLNMKAGPSFGHGIVAQANHEARERDYFFFFAFAAWGAWAALGAVRMIRRLHPALAAIPFGVAALPIALNWSAVNRGGRPEDMWARENAISVIQPLPANAVMLGIGDNDTYPLWYLQQVEGLRRDVTIVTMPLLSAEWNRAELARRYRLLVPADVAVWRGTDGTVREISDRASELGRPVVMSPFADSSRPAAAAR